MPNSTEKVTLVGAGLAGSLSSIYLAKRGFSVDIFERRPDLRKASLSRGRSINLALSVRGIHALKEVGVFERIQKLMIPMRGRMIHSLSGDVSLQPYGKDETEVINSISRASLNAALMDSAETTGKVAIQFEKRCLGFDLKSSKLQILDERTQQEKEVTAPLCIGTDGSASSLRESLRTTSGFQCTVDRLEYGYKELTIPPGTNGMFRMEKNALHIWPRKTFMMIALPNVDGSYTLTLFLPFEGEISFGKIQDRKDVLPFFQTHFPDAVPLMPTLLDDYFTNPTGHMETVRCSPWHYKDRLGLLGDACHAIVPFFGQGMNCAFEDCTVLNEILEKTSDWGQAFFAYEGSRKPNTDAIADLALENFVEMRDRVTDPFFQLKKKVERILEARHPGRFVPKYSMVSFHRIPYATALSRGIKQDAILDQLCRGISSPEEMNLTLADQLIEKEL